MLWAAREARLRRCELIIAYVVPTAGGRTIEGTGGQAAGTTTEVLESNAAAASRRVPEIVIGTLLLHGSVSDRLVELSQQSVLIVVGVDITVPRSAHGVLGPVEDRVVTQARCPVVTVNGPVRDTVGETPVVAVGWVDSPSGRRALRVAVEEAAARGASLTVVSAGATPGGDGGPAGGTRTGRSLQDSLAGFADAHPDVPVDVVHARAQPAEALVRHSVGADLLVIGSHHSGNRFSIRTGPVVEQVIRRATCPVMLVGRLANHVSNGRNPAAENWVG